MQMLSRKGTEFGHAFPELLAELRSLRGRFALDGELVVLDHLGNPQFAELAARARMKKDSTIRAAAKRRPAVIFAFDALVLNGKDLRALPLHRRKELLLRFLKDGERVRYLHHVEERGQTLYEQAVLVDFEGVIGKKTDSAYLPGRASGWIKVKTPSGKERQAARSEKFNPASEAAPSLR
jgi:ATP-dependent DNA ligase